MKLSIIIPTFNEEKTIREVLERISNVRLPNRIKKEIIVVNDGSSDHTQVAVMPWKKKGIVYISHSQNQGKGAAIRSGLAKASGDLIIIQDADLEYHPEYYSKLIRPVVQDNAQVVYGTRLIDYPLKLWGKNKTIMPLNLIANRLLTLLTNLLYRSKLTDMETCYKLFKRQVLQAVSLKSNRFNFEPEITAKVLKSGVSIIEVPIKVKPRTYKEGKKIKWTDGLIAVWTLLKYRFVD